ncbi:MAG: hypothetical protein JW821_20550 [Deltaproteobacteria bacterium]|nr:hypothetical protein [Deltaproteobacteria bacterium]
MEPCRHRRLILIERPGRKLRCLHCHLTIDEKELGDGCCPECLEARGIQRRDFEEVSLRKDGAVEYRCEDCGALIRAGGLEDE